jgi:alkylation response protein AidB-like acyl-CoA dehydrogenase
MAPYLTPQQEALRKETRKLAEEEVAPRAAEIDRTGEYPWDIQKLLASQGLLGYAIPEEYGGSAADVQRLVISRAMLKG